MEKINTGETRGVTRRTDKVITALAIKNNKGKRVFLYQKVCG